MNSRPIELHTRIDIFLFLPSMVLSVLGVLFIYSSGFNSSGINTSSEYIRQIIWVIIGLSLFSVLSFVKYYIFKEFALLVYVLFIILVVVTILTGRVINGARSWIGIGELGIQPSEFLKIATILFLAKQLEKWGPKIKELKYFIYSSLIILIPMAFILLQPDLGTSLVFIPIFLFMMFLSGAQIKHVLFVMGIIFCTSMFTLIPAWNEFIQKDSLPLAAIFTDYNIVIIILSSLVLILTIAVIGLVSLKIQYFSHIIYILLIIMISYLASIALGIILKDYQMMRLIVFLDPYVDPKGSGWNIIQSITAVGSGGFNGKGFLEGTQSHYQFLPAQSTDFIFSIISEELGFLGGLLIFISFTIILMRSLFIITKTKDLFSVAVAAGITGLFFFHIIINIGMAIGIMPITGIPLLLISYGGSSMMASMTCLGILSSINSYRYNF